MKTDRHTYIADRPPIPPNGIPKSGTYQADVGLAGKVVRRVNSDSPKKHPTRLIWYNDRMRQEEKKYSQLLTELKKANWFTRHVSHLDGFIQSSLYEGKAPSGFVQFDVGEPPNAECDIGLMMDDSMSSLKTFRRSIGFSDEPSEGHKVELEATMLTDDEIRHGCGLTMEQVLLRHRKPLTLEKDECSYKNSTQQLIAFQYTLSVRGRNASRSPMIEEIQAGYNKLSDSGGSESIKANRLWLEVGEPYSNFSECDSTAAIDSAGPDASRRIENWHPGSRWQLASLPFRRSGQSIWPIPWGSVMVESVRLVLQRWRGVCSFSQTMRSDQGEEKYKNVYPLCPKKQSRPGE